VPAGPPKQFAVLVGIVFSSIIVVLQFCHAWQAAAVVASILCFFAGLEGFLNFCAGKQEASRCPTVPRAARSGRVAASTGAFHVVLRMVMVMHPQSWTLGHPSAGCWFFGLAIKAGVLPDTAYMVHINTLPETK
jgi:hypothetical protein